MFYITVPYFNLNSIYDSQQTYNWLKIKDDDYVIKHRDKAIRIRQKKDKISISCSEEDFYNIWYNYFDMQRDYDKLHYMYRSTDENIKRYCNKAKGMHIIKQDLLLVIIGCILESKYSHKEVIYIINDICILCGKKRKNTLGGMAISWNEFITLEQIVKDYDKVCRKLSNKIFYDIIEFVSDIKNGIFDFDLLYQLDKKDKLEYLKEFSYINSKAAKRILLLGFNYLDVFPTDKRISKLVKKDFCTDIYDWFYYITGGEIDVIDNMGYLHQVMIYNYNNYT